MLAALIVTYNRVTQLRSCLLHTFALDFDLVVVVDNASTDGTSTLLDNFQSRYRHLQVVRHEVNLGGAGGFATGLQEVDHRLGGAGWVVLFDDDAYPSSDVITCFRSRCDTYEAQGLTGLAARVLSPDGEVVEVNRPIINVFRNPRLAISVAWPHLNGLRDLYHIPNTWIKNPLLAFPVLVDAVSFVGLFLRLDALPKDLRHRYPQANLFLSSDDTIYTMNLVNRGCKLLFDPSLLFYHSSSTGHSSSPWLTPTWRHYYVLRNSFRLHWCISKAWFLPLSLLCIARHAASAILFAYRRQSAGLILVVVVAIFDGIFGNFNRSPQQVMALSSS